MRASASSAHSSRLHRRGRGVSLTEARLLGQRLTGYQLFWMALAMRVTTAVALLPELSSSRAGQDAWLAFLGGILPVAALAWLVAYPSVPFAGRGLVGLARQAFGVWLGTGVALLYLAGYLLATAVILREYTEAIVTAILPSTPPVAIVSVVALLAAVTAAQETAAVGRLALLIGPVVVLSVLIIALLIAPELQLERLQPVMSNGWRGLVSGTLTVMVWHSQYLFYYPLSAAVVDPARAQKALMAAAILASVLGAFVAALTVTVLTGELAVKTAFPFFEVARLVSVGEFVQRIDAIAVGAWGLGLILSSSVFFHAAALALGELLGVPQHRMLVKPMGVVLVVVAIAVARDSIEWRQFTDTRVLVPYAVVLAWIPTALWAVRARLRARRGGPPAARAAAATPP